MVGFIIFIIVAACTVMNTLVAHMIRYETDLDVDFFNDPRLNLGLKVLLLIPPFGFLIGCFYFLKWALPAIYHWVKDGLKEWFD